MDELELQTREVLEGKQPTTNIFPFQVRHPIFMRGGPACPQRMMQGKQAAL